jgi:hypothetical protein
MSTHLPSRQPRRNRPWRERLKAKLRMCIGVCPECNSSAPAVNNCQTCEGYNGDFPPSKYTMARWQWRYTETVCQHGKLTIDPCPECREMFRSFGANPTNYRNG